MSHPVRGVIHYLGGTILNDKQRIHVQKSLELAAQYHTIPQFDNVVIETVLGPDALQSTRFTFLFCNPIVWGTSESFYTGLAIGSAYMMTAILELDKEEDGL